MPIVDADIKLRRSTLLGSAGNTLTQPNAAASLGKYISTTDAPAGLHTLFAKMAGADNAGLVSQYACLFLYNSHASLTWFDARVWLSGGDPAGGATVAMAVDSTAASAVGSSAAQALAAASISAPGSPITILSWSAPTSYANSNLKLGDIPAGSCRAFWVRRVGANSAATPEAIPEQITIAWWGGTLS